MTSVTLFTRAGCCLCQDALKVLDRVLQRHPGAFSLQEVDIESEERLHHRYLERIPVVSIDGQEAFELFLDEAELERRLGIVRAG